LTLTGVTSTAEIEIWRRYFVTAAVTEIATLRAELDGANAG
jgi:hypothetical protein